MKFHVFLGFPLPMQDKLQALARRVCRPHCTYPSVSDSISSKIDFVCTHKSSRCLGRLPFNEE